MSNLVTLAEAKDYLRVEDDWEDATIAMLIEAASAAVIEYADAWVPSDQVPARIKLAVLVRVASSYCTRESIGDAIGEPGLISPYRTLSL